MAGPLHAGSSALAHDLDSPNETRARACLRLWMAGIAALLALLAATRGAHAHGDSPPAALERSAEPTRPQGREQPLPSRVGTTLRFVAGGVSAFALHESSHLIANSVLGSDVGVKRVDFGPVPFFALTQGKELSPREQFFVSSAGFWSQHLTSEIILTSHPGVRHDHAPFEKGVLAFNVLTSAGYAVAAFARIGPAERDPRSVAMALDIPEPWVGALILAPAALDTYRYYRPDSRAARWASRIVKVGAVLLIFVADP